MAGNFVAGGSGSTMKSSFSGDGLLLRQSVYGNASPSEKMVSRLTSTARAAGQAILDHNIASPRAIARMRAENKVKRQELAGTQWQFGTKDDIAFFLCCRDIATEVRAAAAGTHEHAVLPVLVHRVREHEHARGRVAPQRRGRPGMREQLLRLRQSCVVCVDRPADFLL